MSNKKYFKFDEINQYLENDDDINYFSTKQASRVAVGNMLGDFDEKGAYVIDKNIVKELVAMPKIIVDSIDDTDLIRSAIKFDGYLHFMLTINENRASLILLEKINFESNLKYNVGVYSNMNEYVLDEISIPDRDVDKNIIYAKFNISREDQGKYYDINNFTEKELLALKNVIEKMKYNYLVQNKLLQNEKAIEMIEADYFDNVLQAFDKKEKAKKDMIKLLKENILEKQKFILINHPFFQKTINEILDRCLSTILTKLSPAEREEIEKAIRKCKENYYKEINKIIHLNYIQNQQTVEKVEEKGIINEKINQKILDETPAKVAKIDLEKEKLEENFFAIVKQNDELKKSVAEKNSNKTNIIENNPKLKNFFNEIKQETGNDILISQENKNTKPKTKTNQSSNESIKKSVSETKNQQTPQNKQTPQQPPVKSTEETNKIQNNTATQPNKSPETNLIRERTSTSSGANSYSDSFNTGAEKAKDVNDTKIESTNNVTEQLGIKF